MTAISFRNLHYISLASIDFIPDLFLHKIISSFHSTEKKHTALVVCRLWFVYKGSLWPIQFTLHLDQFAECPLRQCTRNFNIPHNVNFPLKYCKFINSAGRIDCNCNSLLRFIYINYCRFATQLSIPSA